MASFVHTVGHLVYRFDSLKEVMAKASPARSGDYLAGVAASNDGERVAAQMTLANIPLTHFLNEALIPYEDDEVTRLIIDTHDAQAFAPVSHLTVGGLRDWLLSEEANEDSLRSLAPGLTPEMAAAVSKIMRVQDLVLVAQKIRVVTRFRGTMGLRGRLSTRLQPNHPTDEPAGIAASILDGLLYGNGDAMIGINPATDSIASICALLEMLDAIIQRYDIPTQACVLTHVTTSIEAINRGVPLDLVFQSIAGTEAANAGFGINLNVLQEGYEAGLSLKRGTLGQNLMYFETGRAARCRPTPTTASTSRPVRPAPMPWPATSNRSWSTPWSVSSAPNTCTTASRSSAPASKTTSAASCWECRWVATSATPTTPKPTRTTWTPC